MIIIIDSLTERNRYICNQVLEKLWKLQMHQVLKLCCNVVAIRRSDFLKLFSDSLDNLWSNSLRNITNNLGAESISCDCLEVGDEYLHVS